MDHSETEQAGGQTHPDFTVVICAHDERRWDRLRAAVTSVRLQALAPSEVIVVVDHNRLLLDRALHDLHDVRVIENRAAKGLGGARNSGLETATSSHVAFIDDDATASERWLEHLGRPYSDPDVAGVGGFTYAVWEAGRPRWLPYEFEWTVGAHYRGMPLIRHDVRNLWGGNMSFRRELITAIGGFQIGPYCDDTELCIRIQQRWPEKRFVRVPEARVSHYVDGSRTTLRKFVSRCYVEGSTKAVVAQAVGSKDALSAERRYTREVLPNGVKKSFGELISGRDPAGLARATLIVVGLLSSVAGYCVAKLAPGRAARKRGWTGDNLRSKTTAGPSET
jgi:GT2 family glycosyltransferase